MRLKISNWNDYQHYKDRSPPWIKLHQSILTSESWILGDDSARCLMIACMLLASRTTDGDGTFNADAKYVQRVAYLNSKPDFKPLIENGFLEYVDDASNVLALCNTEKRQRRDREEERREDTLFGFDDFWDAYDKKVERPAAIKAWKKAKVVNQGMLDRIVDAARAYAASTPDKTYRKNPSTWLNNQCWNDEVVHKQKQGKTQHQINQEGIARSLGLIPAEKRIEGNTYDADTSKLLG